MAITASIITPTGAAIPLGQDLNFTIQLLNSGTTEVTVLNVVPYCAPSSEPTDINAVSAQFGNVTIPPNSPVSPGVTNRQLTFSAVFNGASSANASINVSALIYLSDGTIQNPSTNIHVKGSNNYGN